MNKVTYVALIIDQTETTPSEIIIGGSFGGYYFDSADGAAKHAKKTVKSHIKNGSNISWRIYYTNDMIYTCSTKYYATSRKSRNWGK